MFVCFFKVIKLQLLRPAPWYTYFRPNFRSSVLAARCSACCVCVRERELSSNMSARTSAAIAAGVCGGLFVAYCIYFDKKRRSDPAFKEKLRERKFVSYDRQVFSVNSTWLWLRCVYTTTTSLLNLTSSVWKIQPVTICTVTRRRITALFYLVLK